MAIQTNFPAIKPTLLLDFANTEQLDSRITFTRASTATYYGTQTAKAEQNLLLQSQDFTTTWTTTSLNATITANTTSAPDGTTTADTLTDNATSGIHRVSQTVTTSNTSQMVYSVFAKYSTMQWISISAATGTGTWAGAKFDIQNGVLGSTSQQGTGFTADSSSITAVGNGWYRCVLVYTPGASGSTSMLVSGATDGTTFTTSQRGSEVYTGTGSEVFLWGAQLEQRSAVTAYTPTTTQPITNYIPVLETAASGVARFDHNPTTFESLALLFEEQRTNLLTYSEQFDNAAWTKVRLGNTPDTIIAPDGTLTGHKIFLDSTNSTNHVAGKTVTVTSGTMYTWSVYVKVGELTEVNLRFSAQFPVGNAFFNLSTGVITNIGGVSISSMTPVGNGWYRCSITQTASSTGLAQPQVFLAQSGSITIATGDGYSGVYIWGAQLEAGDFATSYIPTVASQVTRAADAASMTGTDFSSWYNQAAGSFYSEYLPTAVAPSSAAQLVFMVSDGTTSNTLELFKRANADVSTRFSVVSGGVNQVFANLGVFTATATKSAISYSANDFAGLINAGTVVTDTSGNTPLNISQMDIGRSVTAGAYLNGHIRKIAYYPIRLTNTQLQALTS